MVLAVEVSPCPRRPLCLGEPRTVGHPTHDLKTGEQQVEVQAFISALRLAFGGLFPDAGSVQVSPHPEAGSEGEAGHDAALRAEAAQGADQVLGTAVAEEQHEDHVRHLPEGAAPAE